MNVKDLNTKVYHAFCETHINKGLRQSVFLNGFKVQQLFKIFNTNYIIKIRFQENQYHHEK